MDAKKTAAMIGLLALAFAVGPTAVSGQQITRIAVVDLSKVIAAYSKDAQAVKDFEKKKSQVQTDIDAMSAEIMRLMTQKADADKAGDKAASLKLRDDIDRKTKALTDFVSAKQVELDDQAKKAGDDRSLLAGTVQADPECGRDRGLFARDQPEEQRLGDELRTLVQSDDRYNGRRDTGPHRNGPNAVARADRESAAAASPAGCRLRCVSPCYLPRPRPF